MGVLPGLRLTAALAVLVLLGVGAVLLQPPAAVPGESGSYPVLVAGPDGDVLYNGTVYTDHATALRVLEAAVQVAGLDLEIAEHPGYRPCGAYVERIGPYAETATGGWVYEVRTAGADADADADADAGAAADAWERPTVGACAFGLQAGDEVRWRFVAAA